MATPAALVSIPVLKHLHPWSTHMHLTKAAQATSNSLFSAAVMQTSAAKHQPISFVGSSCARGSPLCSREAAASPKHLHPWSTHMHLTKAAQATSNSLFSAAVMQTSAAKHLSNPEQKRWAAVFYAGSHLRAWSGVSPCKPRPNVSSRPCPACNCHSGIDHDMQPSHCKSLHSQVTANSYAWAGGLGTFPLGHGAMLPCHKQMGPQGSGSIPTR